MDDKVTYKLNESKQNDRLAEFQNSSQGHDLSDSISLTKTLIESAANAGQSVLVKDLLNVLANLTKAHRVEQIRAGELLNKQVIRNLARALADIVADAFQDTPGFETRMDRVIERFSGSIQKAHNDEPLQLTDG